MTRSDSDDDNVCLIAVEKVGKKLLAKVPFRVKDRNQTIVCQLDTVASCNVFAASDYRRHGSSGLQKSQTTLTMYDGTVRRSMGPWQTQAYNWQKELTWLDFDAENQTAHFAVTRYLYQPEPTVIRN